MAIDITKLSQSDLLQVVNATPLGPVLTRSQLGRQRDAGALWFSDGQLIHLVKYARWLVGELARPRPGRMEYVEARRRKAARERAGTKAAQDIFPVPEVENYDRRKACGKSFRLFCETYFADVFWRPWSDDHLRVIGKIEKAVLEGGLFVFAMPRGSGKTALARCAAIWAILFGYRPFVCLIAGSDKTAKELLRPVRTNILENPLLLADFPEAIYPLTCLENSSKRQGQQHIQGRLTHVHWGLDRLVFPTVDGDHLPTALRADGIDASPSAGSVITVTSLDANLRGQQHTRPDLHVIRPSLVLLDDPQTRESARSMEQTDKRLELLNGDVLGMAGPGEQISALMTCTKMYEGDLAERLLNKDKSPAWDSECTKLFNSFPTDEKLWTEYAEVRRTKGVPASNDFYRQNQEAMDKGAQVAWPARFDAKVGEISAIQHGMNLRLRVGPEAFAAEYQNEPLLVQASDQALTIDQVLAKVNNYKRGEVPPAATALTMFIDVHDKLLFYVVCAWEEDLTGYVIDYGTFPDQRRGVFALADVTRTLGREFPNTGIDGAILAGMEKLVATYLAKDWCRAGMGSLMKVERLLVDMGYKPGIAMDVKRRVGGSAMMLAKGVGIRASRKPISEYERRPGSRIGHHWYIPELRRAGQFPYVLVDVNYWKRFVHEGLATAAGDRCCLSIFGKDGREHELFAEHVARSETWVEVTGPGGMVREWSGLPTRPDNHWFDCLVGCAAAASMVGCRTADAKPRRPRRNGPTLTLREMSEIAQGRRPTPDEPRSRPRLRPLSDAGKPPSSE